MVTKFPQIWFTIGPNSREPEKIRDLLKAGATGVRLTLSYSTPAWHIEKAKLVKSIANSIDKECFIVADLEGEKYRIGNFEKPTHLEVKYGDILYFEYSSKTYSNVKNILPIRNKSFFHNICVDDIIVVGDASCLLKIQSIDQDKISTIAIDNGKINPNRGIIVQNKLFMPSSLTSKDENDLNEILQYSEYFDAVAVSFVSSSSDVLRVKDHMKQRGTNLPIISKIETQSGVDNIEEITKYSDYIMAARGDLALFTPWTELYGQVSTISEMAKSYNKKWVLATQIMEGLEKFSIPTRAEICDLSNWISKGVDGIMVSYETAFGPKPKEAISCIKALVERWTMI